jgi:PEP-CTERM motif
MNVQRAAVRRPFLFALGTVQVFECTDTARSGRSSCNRGNQTDPLGNQLITITGLDVFTTASFSSTANAFEFSLGSGVPEPSTWAMMALGFAGLGYAAFRRNSKGRALAV